MYVIIQFQQCSAGLGDEWLKEMGRCQRHARSLRSKDETESVQESDLLMRESRTRYIVWTLRTCQTIGKFFKLIKIKMMQRSFHIELEMYVSKRISCPGIEAMFTNMIFVIYLKKNDGGHYTLQQAS